MNSPTRFSNSHPQGEMSTEEYEINTTNLHIMS